MTSIIEQIERELPSWDYLTSLQKDLLTILEKHGPAQRRTFVKLLNTPRTTVYDNLLKLKKRDIVEKFKFNNGKKGAPVIYWKLKKEVTQ